MTRTALLVGSGFDAFDYRGERRLDTAFGAPSAPVREATIAATDVLVLPRHGDRHEFPPHLINYRANLAALKELGADTVIALNTVGVVSDLRLPGQIAVPDQVIDYTWGRAHTIFDTPRPGFEHVECTEPFSAKVRRSLLDAASVASLDCYDGGVYAATQGPRLETAAEVDRLERDGADYVGMTAMPEAILALEMQLDYACLCLVVNKAAGRGDKPIHDDVESSTSQARSAALKLLKACLGRTP